MIARRTIISGSTGPIFAIFSLNESVWDVDDRSEPLFPMSLETLPWQPIVWKNGKLLSFVALAFRNGIGYHYLSVHINSVNDASTLCLKKNDNDVLRYNFNAHKPILIIFGRDIAE